MKLTRQIRFLTKSVLKQWKRAIPKLPVTLHAILTVKYSIKIQLLNICNQ